MIVLWQEHVEAVQLRDDELRPVARNCDVCIFKRETHHQSAQHGDGFNSNGVPRCYCKYVLLNLVINSEFLCV